MYVASVSSGVEYVCNDFSSVFQVFSQLFQMLVSIISDACFYVAIVVSACFKSILDVAHGMRVESGWRHMRRSGRPGPAAGVLAHDPDNARVHARLRCGHRPDASTPDRTSGANKSV
jgi:hypothetical protein